MLKAGSKEEVRARVNCARLAISILSHWLARQRLNYTTGRSLSKQRKEPVHPCDFMYFLPPIPNVEDYSGSDRAVTTCRLPLQIVCIVDIQQFLANLDTMSTLVRDTLVSRAEPPPSGWTDITLEQTFKYWSRCRGTRFTLLIMQGIKYEYKQIMKYISDTTKYKSRKYK